MVDINLEASSTGCLKKKKNTLATDTLHVTGKGDNHDAHKLLQHYKEVVRNTKQ